MESDRSYSLVIVLCSAHADVREIAQSKIEEAPVAWDFEGDSGGPETIVHRASEFIQTRAAGHLIGSLPEIVAPSREATVWFFLASISLYYFLARGILEL